MKRLYRSRDDRRIAGILGGMGEVYNVDPNLLRLLAILLLFATGVLPVVITYIVAWIILPDGKPEEPTKSSGEEAPEKEKNKSTKKSEK